MALFPSYAKNKLPTPVLKSSPHILYESGRHGCTVNCNLTVLAEVFNHVVVILVITVFLTLSLNLISSFLSLSSPPLFSPWSFIALYTSPSFFFYLRFAPPFTSVCSSLFPLSDCCPLFSSLFSFCFPFCLFLSPLVFLCPHTLYFLYPSPFSSPVPCSLRTFSSPLSPFFFTPLLTSHRLPFIFFPFLHFLTCLLLRQCIRSTVVFADIQDLWSPSIEWRSISKTTTAADLMLQLYQHHPYSYSRFKCVCRRVICHCLSCHFTVIYLDLNVWGIDPGKPTHTRTQADRHTA